MDITQNVSDDVMLSFLRLEDVQVVDNLSKAKLLNKLYVVRYNFCWMVVNNQFYHNPYGPSLVNFYTYSFPFNKKIKSIYYHLYGFLHRANKPAEIVYNSDGLIIKECYYLNNKLHNSTGPALREYRHNKWNNYYYKYGIAISKENFLNMV